MANLPGSLTGPAPDNSTTLTLTAPKAGLLSRLAASTGDAATTDSWFWRRWNIYGTELGCFALIAYILEKHLARISQIFAAGAQTGVTSLQADSGEAQQIIWWAFALWATALLIHVFGPSAEKILLALAQLIAARFGIQLPAGSTLKSTSTTTTAVETPVTQG